MSARKALARLAREGHLPPAWHAPPPRRRHSSCSGSFPPQPIRGELDQFRPLEIVLLPEGRSELSREWNQLLERHHYLGGGPLCGAQLRYLVRSTQGETLAALAFSAAAWQVAGRDRWIGWSSEARRQNLHRVVNNSRWLIPAYVEVPNLASHVLSRVLQRLPGDWRSRYGYAPVLVESFVDEARFAGHSYRAANWQAIAITQGRGRQDARHQRACSHKRLWIYSLTRDFRHSLRQIPSTPRLPPLMPVGCTPSLAPAPRDWAEAEFGWAPLGDRRLVRRGCQLARAFYARPQAQLPEACGSRASTKAAYRFLDNPRVTMAALLQSHYEATAARLATEPLVLAVQDTTALDYHAHPATEMLGPIGHKIDGPIGMLVHNTLAFNPEGTPLGLVDVQCWSRDPEQFGKRHLRYELPFEEKESVRWLRSLQALESLQRLCPNTRLVSVGDREADIYELLVWSTQKAGRPALLVRAERRRTLTQEQGPLWTHVRNLPLAAQIELRVPRRANRPARTARLEVRFGQVELKPPKIKPQLGPVRVGVILAREAGAAAGNTPLEWMLLTTLAVDTVEQAVEKLRWYGVRWGIEVFHRVLKSGCRIEDRQLGAADRLEACLAIDLVVAWRIYYLNQLGRQTPDVPCTAYFGDHEWKALRVFLTRSRKIPSQPPTLQQMIRMVAGLGGFLGRKGDGEPGTQVLWRGIQRLDDIAMVYLALTDPHLSSSTVSSDRDYG
jgi:Druantia protein DruA/Transposase DNA-binding/Transposase Tn5 dimerisation domain